MSIEPKIYPFPPPKPCTEALREEVAITLKKALEFLWDGKDPIQVKDAYNTFICLGISKTSRWNREAVKRIVLERLGCDKHQNEHTYTSYLREVVGVPGHELTVEVVQANRIAWVKSLIEEFES